MDILDTWLLKYWFLELRINYIWRRFQAHLFYTPKHGYDEVLFMYSKDILDALRKQVSSTSKKQYDKSSQIWKL